MSTTSVPASTSSGTSGPSSPGSGSGVGSSTSKRVPSASVAPARTNRCADGPAVAAGLGPQAAVVERRVLEREPQPDHRVGLGPEEGGSWWQVHLAADAGLLEDVHRLEQRRVGEAEVVDDLGERRRCGEKRVEHRVEVVLRVADLVDRPLLRDGAARRRGRRPPPRRSTAPRRPRTRKYSSEVRVCSWVENTDDRASGRSRRRSARPARSPRAHASRSAAPGHDEEPVPLPGRELVAVEHGQVRVIRAAMRSVDHERARRGRLGADLDRRPSSAATAPSKRSSSSACSSSSGWPSATSSPGLARQTTPADGLTGSSLRARPGAEPPRARRRRARASSRRTNPADGAGTVRTYSACRERRVGVAALGPDHAVAHRSIARPSSSAAAGSASDAGERQHLAGQRERDLDAGRPGRRPRAPRSTR